MGRTATNPKTGETIEWNGKSWAPVGATAGIGRAGEPTFKTPFLDELAARGPGLGFDTPAPQSTGRQEVPASPLSGITPQMVMPPSVSAPAPVEAPLSAPLAQEREAPEAPVAPPLKAPVGGNNAYDSGGDPLGAFDQNFPDMHDPLLGEQFMTGVDRLQQGAYATLAGPTWRALQTFDRIDRGETVPETEDPTGYQYMAPEQRAQVRADAERGLAQNAVGMTNEKRQADARMKNPVAGEVIKSLDEGKYGQAWDQFTTDPGGVIQQTAVESAALALPAAGAGLLAGPIGGVPAALATMSVGSYPLEYGLGLTEKLERLGVNTSDPIAVQTALKDPAITAQIQEFAHGRGAAVAGGELLVSPLAKLFPGGPGALTRIGSAAGTAGVEVGGEMFGEAAAQQAVGDEFQLGQVLAEGVGSGPTAAVAGAVSAATPPETPPTAATPGAPRIEPTLGSPAVQQSSIPRAPMAVPPQYAGALDQATSANGLPGNLLSNMMIAESGGNPNAVSPAGAQGLMQFMPPTAAQYGVNTSDPISSINGAGRYMRDLMNQFGNNPVHAVAAYNWGPGNVRRWLRNGGDMAALPAETQAYIGKVLGPNGAGMAEHTAGVTAAQARAPWAANPQTFGTGPETRTLEEVADLAQAKRFTDDEVNKLIFGATGKSALEDLTDPGEILTAFDALSEAPANPSQTDLRTELEAVVTGETPVEEIVASTEATINPAPTPAAAPEEGARFMVDAPGWDAPEPATIVERYTMEDGEGGYVDGVRLQNAEGSIVYDGPISGITLQPIDAPTVASPEVQTVSSPALTENPPVAEGISVSPEQVAPTAATPSPLSAVFTPGMAVDANVTVQTSPTSVPQTPTALETSPPNLVQSPPVTEIPPVLGGVSGSLPDAQTAAPVTGTNNQPEAVISAPGQTDDSLTDDHRRVLSDALVSLGRPPFTIERLMQASGLPRPTVAAWQKEQRERAKAETAAEKAPMAVLERKATGEGMAADVARKEIERRKLVAAKGGERRQIGTNADGNPLFEDERGVRSYVESGIRVSENVGINPGGGISINSSARGGDFQTAEERQTADSPEVQTADSPAKGPLPVPEAAFGEILAEAAADDEGIPYFTPPPATTQKEREAKFAGELTTEQADKRLLEWKEHARAQAKTGKNNGKVVLSLFDASGVWSQPWADAGYDVYRFDIQDGMDINKFSVEYLTAELGIDRADVILAAPPCTDFSSSGAHAWGKKDADGRTEASIELVRQTLRTVELYRPSIWSLENPVGRIAKLVDLPKATMTFQPHNFGDPFTKRTLLWGDFKTDLPLANVAPTEGSKITEKLSGTDKYGRSITPEGFAYSFFMANNLIDMGVVGALAAEFKGVPKADLQAAVDAGLSEQQIRHAIEDAYHDGNLVGVVADLHMAVEAYGEPSDSPEVQTVDSPDAEEGQPNDTPDAPEADPTKYGNPDAPNVPMLGLAFSVAFARGKRFATIAQARAYAAALMGGKIEPGTPAQKAVDEAIEYGAVRHASMIAHREGSAIRDGSAKGIFDALVDLYDRMPNLGTRTSTSIQQQAYSTPVPLAWVASKLAGITNKTVVYEPTAGNGALLIGANPENVIANELNPGRRDNLDHLLGPAAQVTERNAVTWKPSVPVDVVIANPPFGVLKGENGKNQRFTIPFSPELQREFKTDGYETSEIDHAISFKALESMKDDGSAVLILGGVNKLKQGESRSDAYNAGAKRNFFLALYRTYNVVDHFTVSGDLYQKQGAGWPVDVIVIRGRGRSARKLPAADVPVQVNTWEEVGRYLEKTEYPVQSGVATGGRDSSGADGGAAAVGAGEAGSAPVSGSDVAPAVGSAGGAAGPGTGGAAGGAGVRAGGAGADGRADAQSVGGGDGSDRGQSELQDVVEPTGRSSGGSTGAPDSGRPGDPQGGGSGGVSGTHTGDVAGVEDDGLDAIFEAELAAAFGDEPASQTASSPTVPPSDSPDTRSTPKVAADAAKSGLMGLDEVASGLTALFGAGPGRVSSGVGFDKDTYEKAKPFFLAGVQHFKDAAADVTVLVRRLIETLRDQFNMARETIAAMQPYIVQFVRDVKAGTISLTPAEPKAPKAPVERKADTETAGQVTYEPKSKVGNVGTLVPRNLQTVTRDALDDLAERVGGDLDAFVAKKLGYDADDVGRYFSAEQIDAIALGIDNIDKDAGFIIGDQTGVGKGRVVAAMIRYAMKQGKTPIFATEKPNLYKDMYRDLSDIGMPEVRILMTNAAESVPLDDDSTKFLKTPQAGKHNAALMRIANEMRGNPDALRDAGYDVVFTTYSQMQPVKQDVTARMRFLDAISEGAFVILDESHNAGGTEAAKGRDGKEEKEELSRSSFARAILAKASSVFYSSATYAKRPQSMSLYFKTDMRLAVPNINQLADLISSGGVPMQQVVASMLAQAGQYIRRERSFAGVVYDAKPVPVDNKTYDEFAKLINEIQIFSEKYVMPLIKKIDKDAKEDAKSATGDNSTGGAGAESTNFSSVMHNLIDQMLLAAKAPEAVKLAIEALERGEKPVLTVANTMGSFLTDYAEQAGVSNGDAIEINFNSLLERYIERCRWFTIKPPFMRKGEKGERVYLDDDALGADGLAYFKRVMKMIQATNFGTMPVSPIDYMSAELRKAGYKVGEITGRTNFIDYQTNGTAYLRTRPTKDTGIAGRLLAITRFNGGDVKKPLEKDKRLDVMILNQAGATGLSLHANAKFGDQSKRQMIIVQAEKNIDVHMQMLGRVHRTGQVIAPSYIQMVADVPAEKRPAAVLSKKMASLSANTTASRKGALAAEDVPDFLNEYGDQVAARIMTDNPDIHKALWSPLKGAKDGEYEEEEAMRKVTGRIPLLPLVEQLSIYELLESEYTALIQQLDEAGENALEAKFLDLDAKVLSSKEMSPPQSGSKSPFAGGVTLERVDIKRQGKPPKTESVISEAGEALGLEKIDGDTVTARIATVRKAGQQAMQALFSETRKTFDAYKREVLDDIEGEKQQQATRVRLVDSMNRLTGLMKQLPVGAGIRVRTGRAEGDVYGTVIGFKTTGKARNPAALGSWKVTIQTLTAGRQTIPLSQLWPQGTEMSTLPERHFIIENAPLYKEHDLIEMYDQVQADRREERWMITGNLLAGFSHVSGVGSIVNFSDTKGDVRQGILMPRDYDPVKAAESRAVSFSTAEQILQFLMTVENPVVTTADGALTIKPSRGGAVTIDTKASRSDGGKYFMDQGILDAAGRDFVKVGNVMRIEAPASRMRLMDVIGAIMKVEGADLRTTANLDKARQITGQAAPKAERLAGVSTGRQDHPDAAVVEALAALVNRMTGGRAKLTVTKDRLFVDGHEVRGLQWGDLVAVTLAYGAGAAKRNIRHETIHVLRAVGLLSDAEWATLTKAAEKWRRDYDIDARYSDATEEVRIEEAVAAAFAGENRPMGPVKTIFTRISEFLKRFYRALVSKDFRTAEDIFSRIESGEIGERSDWYEQNGVPMADRSDEFARLLFGTPRNSDGTFAVKTELLASVRTHADNTRRAVRSIFKGVEVPKGVDLITPPAARDLNVLKRFIATPSSLFKPWPQLDKLVQDGIKTEIESSVWVNRLNKRYTAIRKDLTEDEWGRTAEALWAGDEAQISLTDEDLVEFGLKPKEAKAFRQITELLETLARVVDMHRRQMLPQVRKRKMEVEKRLKRLAATARVMTDDEFTKKYSRRSYLARRLREGKGDPVAITAEIGRINDELAAIRMADPDVSRKYDKLREEYDALEARLAATSVRRREGYVPHKFYGGWRLHEETGTDANGDPVWRELTSDQGFYDDKVTALRAAEDYLKANPNAALKVEPKTIKFPFSQEGTQLSDAAYERFVRKVAQNAGVQGEELRNMISGVARKRFRRRIYAAGQYRTGHKGWNRDIDRVMRTHIGQSVRYVTMDKMKFNVINTMEGMGLSPYKVLTREQKVLFDAFNQWWTDLNGQKQTLEEQFDSLLNKEWVTPLRAAMVTMAPTMLIGGAAINPFFGMALGGYLGYRVYRAVKSGGDFKTRALTGSFLSDMAHLKLGAVFNVGSAIVNLTQLSINTYPVLGEKYATIGIARATKALFQSAIGKTTPDTVLLGRADVDTSFRFAETHPGLFQQETKLAQASMFLFQKAETLNRAATLLGAYARAEAKGMSHGDALREAKSILLRTQFHYGAANKPELLRNTFARVPLQFKTFMVNQITFVLGLRRAEIPRFLGALVLVGGLLGFPGLQMLDLLADKVSGISPIQSLKDWSIDRMADGDTAGTVAAMVARGLPGYAVDITSRVGMGDRFLPSQWSDLQGPWLSTITSLAELQSQGAGAVDQLRALTGGAAPLKSLEALANGMPLTSMVTSPTAFGEALFDDETVITNPYLKGAKEYEPTTAELLWKGVGLRPVREAQLADVRGGAEREIEKRQKQTRPVLTAMIAAYRSKGGDAEGEKAAELVIENAAKRGIVVTKMQISTAFKDALTDREFRTLKRVPKVIREDTARRTELLNEYHAQ